MGYVSRPGPGRVKELADRRAALEMELAEVRAEMKALRPALSPCGTNAAYARHKRKGEAVDEACLAAHAEYTASRRVRSVRLLLPCGTAAAYRRHLRAGEVACDECVAAASEARAARRAKEHPGG